MNDLTSQTILVFGLARTGLATIQWLKNKGARVIAIDSDPVRQQQAQDLGAQIVDKDTLDWGHIDILVQSPGISLNHPLTQEAQKHKILICGDVDLFRWSHPNAKVVGITGTNGKSTTTAMVTHILQSSGIPTAMGGNIGVPALSLPDLPPEGIYVLELSSYQLDLSHSLNLDYVGIINISPDHLDRHGTFDAYSSAKRKILNHESDFPVTVLSIDDDCLSKLHREIKGVHPDKIISISLKGPADYTVHAEALYGEQIQEPLLTFPVNAHLRGLHNYQNCLVAYALCRQMGISADQIISAMKTFTGLTHRQEYVRRIDRITFINDSKATNGDATARALSVFDDIYWIAGGVPKSDGIEMLHNYFPKIRGSFLIGEAQESFSKTLQGKIPVTLSDDLKTAVEEAFTTAKNDVKSGKVTNPTILFSPACASFDQFKDFEHRGDVFKEIVSHL